MADFVSKLNPEQRDAVTTIDGPLLVLAGAGTGKTRVITCRIAYMIEKGIDPSSILGVTFTNKAAKEMRERLDRMVDPVKSKKVCLGTFHSFCARVLRRDIAYAGNYNPNFSIADESDQKGLLRQAAAELGFSKEEAPVEDAASFIGDCKNKMLWPEDAAEYAAREYPAKAVLAQIYAKYQRLMELQNSVDFDDLLLLALKIFSNAPEVLKRYQETYKYLLVDEYQDTNAAQFSLLKQLCGSANNICVVGDDDQSIYGWRGAEVENILDFPKMFPGAKEIKLEQNYRSTNKILEAANSVISRNGRRYSKSLWSAKGHGENIRVVGLRSGEEEASFVADAITDMVARNPEMSMRDFIILYRSNYLSRQFEQEFRARGIRPKLIGGQEFFQRKEVKDAASYLKLIINPRDDQSLLRVIAVPPRGIGEKAIETLRSLQSASHLPLSEILADEEYLGRLSPAASSSARNFAACLIEYRAAFAEPGQLSSKARNFLDDIGYLNGLQRIYKDIKESERRQENVYEFLNYMAEYERRRDLPATLREFVESYSLMDENDRTEDDDESREAPTLSTVHAAKGLEYPCVFIVGVEHNLFPHERSIEENTEDEERRLFYVAITRARETLFITHCGARLRYGALCPQLPSKFIKDLPEDIVDETKNADALLDELSGGAMYDSELRNAFADILKNLRD